MGQKALAKCQASSNLCPRVSNDMPSLQGLLRARAVRACAIVREVKLDYYRNLSKFTPRTRVFDSLR